MVYIDPKREDGWSHLVADEIKELHTFAEKIGLKRCWFSNKRNKKQPHYDIKDPLRKKAIENGAQEISSKEIVEFLKRTYK